jgi:hypothetical protein
MSYATARISSIRNVTTKKFGTLQAPATISFRVVPEIVLSPKSRAVIVLAERQRSGAGGRWFKSSLCN